MQASSPRTPPCPACVVCEVSLPRAADRFRLRAPVGGEQWEVCELCALLGGIGELLRSRPLRAAERALVATELRV
eukprot:2761289-Lingulodinium_polyedra.AAC.1